MNYRRPDEYVSGINLSFRVGTDFVQAARYSLSLATSLRLTVKFEFNGFEYVALPDSTMEWLRNNKTPLDAVRDELDSGSQYFDGELIKNAVREELKIFWYNLVPEIPWTRSFDVPTAHVFGHPRLEQTIGVNGIRKEVRVCVYCHRSDLYLQFMAEKEGAPQLCYRFKK